MAICLQNAKHSLDFDVQVQTLRTKTCFGLNPLFFHGVFRHIGLGKSQYYGVFRHIGPGKCQYYGVFRHIDIKKFMTLQHLISKKSLPYST